jgi:hypothetical protein
MPNWHDILNEIGKTGSPHDVVRRNYLKLLSEYTGRNTIVYYSGWLQKNVPGTEVNDSDKTGFMTVINGLDRTKGLDLILHTPGGLTAATESLVDYLHNMFDNDIRAIVPQLAMSAGTMIACSCKSILMGKQSNLGPIDPQLGPLPAHGIVEEFKRAYSEIKEAQINAITNPNDPSAIAEVNTKIALWQPIIAKYSPALIGECEKNIEWSETMVKDWLTRNMLSDLSPADLERVRRVIMTELADHAVSKSHGRHIPMQKCIDIGLKVERLEDDPKLQDLVLSVHHSCIHTLSETASIKIIENQNGIAFIQMAQMMPIPKPAAK